MILSAGTKPIEDIDQRVDIGAGIVKRQRGTHRTFHAEAAEDRLSAVMTCAHRNTLFVERLPYLVIGKAIHDKG